MVDGELTDIDGLWLKKEFKKQWLIEQVMVDEHRKLVEIGHSSMVEKRG